VCTNFINQRLLLIALIVVSPAAPALADTSHHHSHSVREATPAIAEDPWSERDMLQPEDLAPALSSKHKPLVLQVGVQRLYRSGHIPGSKYAGMASTPEGIASLKKEVQSSPRASEVVIYCGCCPWKDCPNIRPAYKALREMGFTKVKVLNLPANFTQDWAQRGFPVEKDQKLLTRRSTTWPKCGGARKRILAEPQAAEAGA